MDEEKNQIALALQFYLGVLILAALLCWPLSLLWNCGFAEPFELPVVNAFEFFCISVFLSFSKAFIK
jgi:hypothetical protein